MRIQHNIMAMNAYRNYTNNVNAMKKNLEKLSSGYKINRAGDDAAGLAISEKMRAQITGLETAQKNAKDGISLVQTAEGALTEVHDMLNRMVELATQSANGTYDNTTDRFQLQKEMNQLRSEIDRIADSANFNGIKLLDGSMSSAAAGAVSNIESIAFEKATDSLDAIKFEYVTNRPDAVTGGSDKAYFEVSLDDFAVSGGTSTDKQTFTLTVGGKTITASHTGASWTASSIATALKAAGDGSAVKSDGKTISGTSGDHLMIDGHIYKMAGSGNTITFTQVDSRKEGETPVLPSFEVKGTLTASSAKDGFKAVGTLNTQVQVTTAGIPEAGQHQAQAEATIDFSKLKQDDFMKVGEVTYKFNFEKLASSASLWDNTNKVKTIDLSDLQEKLDSGEITEKEFQERAMVKITEQMARGTGTAGTPGTTAISAQDEWSVGNGGVKNGVGTLTFQSKSTKPNGTGAGKIDLNNESKVMARFSAGAPANDAKTTFDLDVTKIKAGDTITVDGATFEFTNGATPSNANNIAIDLSSLNFKDGLTASQTQDVVDKMKAAIEGKTYGGGAARFSVTNNDNKVTISVKDLAATTDVLENQTAPKITATGSGGLGLTLQIGDTADSWNQLKVDIGDTHVAALGIDKISIADQESAQKAIDSIKSAINQVSDIRGTLGATQNRLDHTINNLSVMTENIQDAESTIRDTDVAAEMMAYTKNNILIQSAQAMLAQANQVPQGVLQLLQ